MIAPEKIVLKSVSDLKPYEKNSRTHSIEQIEQIKRSILEFGFTNPILIDENNQIIAGHGRVEAAKLCKMEKVPTVVLSHLNDEQKRAYIIADNKLALNAGWDEKILSVELDELKELDFDLSLTGFSADELSALMKDDELRPIDADEDAVPEAPKNPLTKLGDIWILGNHRLMCGDATSAISVKNLLNGQSPNIMITDPPYGVEYEAGWRADAKGRIKTEREQTSNLKNDNRADWYDAWILFNGNIAYVWHASAFTDVVKHSLEKADFQVRQQIIWNKNVHALSRSAYHWKHEPCWYAVRNGADARWLAGRDQMTVWDIPSVIFEKDKTSHPTQKSLGIYERAIENHTKKGEPIYEPFGGSGTQIIACEKSGRVSLTMELDPKFCDVIVKRWQDFTGKKAYLESNGKLFDELAANNDAP